MATDRGTADAIYLLHRVGRIDQDETSVRELFTACSRSRFKTVTDLIPAIDRLVDHGYLSPTPAPKPTGGRPASPRFKVHKLAAPSARITDTVDALADHLAKVRCIEFGEIIQFVEAHGIDTEGDEQLTGEHVNQPHVSEGTTLLAPVSDDYIQIVESLFKTRPVMLEIGDPATFTTGDEPWWVTWTGHRDAVVESAIELVHDQGAVSFVDLVEHVRARGVSTHGYLTMLLGKHAIGDGVFSTQPLNSRNVVLWNQASADFITIIELMLLREPQVVLERTDVVHYRLLGIEGLKFHPDDTGPLPPVNFGTVLDATGYENPTWLPVLFAWAGGD